MAKKYKMTPKRKAALRKAQLASARKRRGRRHRQIAAVVGGVGVLASVGTAAYMGRGYIRGVLGGGPKTPGKELVHVPGLGRTYVNLDAKPKKSTRKKKYLNYVQSEKLRLQKEATRQRKNFRQRRKYWRSKPVPKVSRGR